MVNPILDSTLPPLTVDDLQDDNAVLPIPPDIIQLQTDTANVVEGRVPIDNFSPEYQERIKAYYQFSASYSSSKNPHIAQRTFDTLDLI